LTDENERINKKVIEHGLPTSPPYFGCHPSYKHSEKAVLRHARRKGPGHYIEILTGQQTPLENFYDPRHPSVYVIPRDRFLKVVDEFGDVIGFEEIQLPFSSTNFFTKRWDDDWVFEELSSAPFWRLGEISQLGYLVPPFPEKIPFPKISFAGAPFTHTRWIHCLLAAAMAEVILTRNGFSKEERAPMVLSIAYHDIAMPAGGDSIKRVDPDNLDEENNFGYILEKNGLAKQWKAKFNFNLDQARKWVLNQGTIGFLLDILDKMSYVALDCYYQGRYYDSDVRQHCLQYPLFMDAWQDIRFSPDRQTLGFTDPEKLFQFALARALEHRELLLNPYARILDFFLTDLVKPLYNKGVITKDQLLEWGTQRLQNELAKYYPKKKVQPAVITPDEYGWKKFQTKGELNEFCSKIKNTVYHTEHIKGFKTCLDWPIFTDTTCKTTVPLQEKLKPTQISTVESTVASVRGYYAYWYTPTS